MATGFDQRRCHGGLADGRDFIGERPGIVRAAIADIPPSHPEFGPDHVATALHRIVEDSTTAYWAAQTGLRFDGWGLLSGFHVLVIDRDQVSRLGHEWCNRLIPVTGHRSNELGFALLFSMMSDKDAAAHQWWADPLNPHVVGHQRRQRHAVRHDRHTSTGMGSAGRSDHRPPTGAQRGEQLVFIRDGNRDTWPMPTTHVAHYCAGAADEYHGHRMASSLATLCDNAVRGTALERFIASTPPPGHSHAPNVGAHVRLHRDVR